MPVGFAAVLAFPSGAFKNAFRGHRTVILPDYQGMGFGNRLSDAVAEIHLSEGKRYFSKTVHPKMGAYRNASDKWRGTSKNMKARPDYNSERQTKEKRYKKRHAARIAFSHEYMG